MTRKHRGVLPCICGELPLLNYEYFHMIGVGVFLAKCTNALCVESKKAPCHTREWNKIRRLEVLPKNTNTQFSNPLSINKDKEGNIHLINRKTGDTREISQQALAKILLGLMPSLPTSSKFGVLALDAKY